SQTRRRPDLRHARSTTPPPAGGLGRPARASSARRGAPPAGPLRPFLPTAPSPSRPRGQVWPLPAPVGPRLTGLKHKPRRTTTMPNDDLACAHAESAALLNLDPDKLSPADALKCDLVSALRLVVDDELARATSGNGADLGKLIVAVEHLTGFMRDAKSAEPEDKEEDPNYDWTKDPDSPKYKLKAYLDLSIEAAREDERYN